MLKSVMQAFKRVYQRIRGVSTSKTEKNVYQLDANSNSNSSSSLNIIFIVPAIEGYKAGGDKVIYKQSEVINQMRYRGVSSQILHPDNHQFMHTWFEHNAQTKQSNQLSAVADFVIIPEVMVIPHAKMLASLGIRYGIYVQNGYSASIPLYVGSDEELSAAYQNAELILSISDDTSECIQLAFPKVASKIQRIFYSVDSNKFKPSPHKENLITYMPRKLARHSDLVKFFLEHNLPSDWHLAPIHGLNEDGVADLLSRSKIFLSFSEFEGCPLPPVEAALTGNFIVGYTGEGAREYWQPPVFTLVDCGDVKNYVAKVLEKVKMLETETHLGDDSSLSIRDALASKYSKEAEQSSLRQVIDRISN
jgi:hypothetical protein